MRFTLLTSLTAATAITLSPQAIADTTPVYVGDAFECYFLNSGESMLDGVSYADWTSDQIESAKRALTTWDNLIANQGSRRLTVGFTWVEQSGNTLASGGSSAIIYGTSDYEKVNNLVEEVWRDGQVFTYWSGSYFDINVVCDISSNTLFYYGADASGIISTNKVDFQSVILHEIGHAMGIASWTTPSGSLEEADGTKIYSTYDSLIVDAEGNSIIDKIKNGEAGFTLGEDLYLEGTSLKIYNPDTWEEGSSLSHVTLLDDSAGDLLMYPAIGQETIHRELTDEELQLLQAMNWVLIPEPSTATLSLLGLAGILLRRRRSVNS